MSRNSQNPLWKLPRGNLILASRSPRRRKLLKEQNLEFFVHPSRIVEKLGKGPPRVVAREIALQKARAIADRHPRAWIIGADTLVVSRGVILGKPGSQKQSREMLGMLSGRVHEVVTGVAVVGPGFERSRSEVTRVRFHKLTRSQIQGYAGLKEPYDKAGSYALQGVGAILVRSIEGDWTNVIGLPLGALRTLLGQAAIWQARR